MAVRLFLGIPWRRASALDEEQVVRTVENYHFGMVQPETGGSVEFHSSMLNALGFLGMRRGFCVFCSSELMTESVVNIYKIRYILKIT